MSRPYNHDWKSRAREAKSSLEGVPEGERETTLWGIAGDRDLNTLRKSLAAFDFLERWTVEQPEGARLLEDAPQSVVEVVARWSGFDQDGALAAARQWNSEKTPVQKLTERMREARSTKGIDPGRLLGTRYRKSMAATLEKLVVEHDGGRVKEVQARYRNGDDPPVDFRFRTVGARTIEIRSVACLIVGPYRNPDLYRKRRHDWISRALALAWVHDAVLLVLPEETHLGRYRESLRDIALRATKTNWPGAARSPVVYVVHHVASEDDAWLAQLGETP